MPRRPSAIPSTFWPDRSQPPPGSTPHTVQLTLDIERVCRRHGLSRQQYALAAALWRSVTQHPMLRVTVDFEVGKIVLTDGGRRITFEADVFPPPVPPRRDPP